MNDQKPSPAINALMSSSVSSPEPNLSPSAPSPSTAAGPAARGPAARRAPARGNASASLLNHVTGANYAGVDWRGRQISRTLFENVSFQGADLRGVVFEDVIFRRCNFQGACLDGAQLRSVCATYVLAEGVSLRHVRGENTQWIGCFREADFTGSQWSRSNFYSSDLRGAIGVRSFRDGKLRPAPAPAPLSASVPDGVVSAPASPLPSLPETMGLESGLAAGPSTGRPVTGGPASGPVTGSSVADAPPVRTGGTAPSGPSGFPPFRDRFPDR